MLDAQTLLNGDSFTFSTEAADLDVLGTPSGSGGYQELVIASERYALGEGLEVQVIGLDDLIRVKLAAGRGKDLLDAEALRRIRRLREIGEVPRPGSQTTNS